MPTEGGDYIPFNFLDLDGCSTESIALYSTLCISNRLQFIVCIFFIILSSFLSSILLYFFTRMLYEKRDYKSTPMITLFFAIVLALCLLSVQISRLMGVDGMLSTFFFISPAFGGYPGLTFVNGRWYEVVLGKDLRKDRRVERKAKISILIFNIFATVSCLVSSLVGGYYDYQHIELHNTFMGLTLVLVGLSCCIMGFSVLYVGRLMIKLLLQMDSFQEELDARVKASVIKVRRYKRFQSTILVSSGIASITYGIVVMCLKVVPYYYYFYNFGFYPGMLLASAFLGYVTISGQQETQKTDSNDTRNLQNSSSYALKQQPTLSITVPQK